MKQMPSEERLESLRLPGFGRKKVGQDMMKFMDKVNMELLFKKPDIPESYEHSLKHQISPEHV